MERGTRPHVNWRYNSQVSTLSQQNLGRSRLGLRLRGGREFYFGLSRNLRAHVS